MQKYRYVHTQGASGEFVLATPPGCTHLKLNYDTYPSITYIHLKNPTFNLSPISILTTPNENWGKKVGVIKNLCVYDNGKGVKIVKNIFCRSVPHA